MRKYSVYLNGCVVGNVVAQTDKLYYKFSCLCRFAHPGRYRISVFSGTKEISLGICVPMDGGFGFRTSIPMKRVGEGELRFLARFEDQEDVVPVFEEKPFLALERLREGKLSMRDQDSVIVFPLVTDRS